MIDHRPQRIVCLTEESTELLYLLGEQDRIVGISGFTVRPKVARKEKPKVSLFTDASIDKIVDLKPDLVIGFSDIQAGIASDLIKRGLNVWITNQRSIAEIEKNMLQLGILVGREVACRKLLAGYKASMSDIQEEVRQWKRRPGVYFEEWFDPLISGIQWVSELIELAGGKDVFPEHVNASLAKDRILEDPDEVIRRDPDIILASWCGKAFKKPKLISRDGWENIKAIKQDQIHEIDSAIILQPGPAALSEGLQTLHEYFKKWQEQHG